MHQNSIEVSGIIKDIVFSHIIKEQKFNQGYIETLTSHGNATLPVILPVSISGFIKDGDAIRIRGSIRSKRHETDGKFQTEIFIFTEGIERFDDAESAAEIPYYNHVVIEGYICRSCGYRETQPYAPYILFTLAVRRGCGHTHYIICKATGDQAKLVSDMNIGTLIRGTGIMSSFFDRKYCETKYEVILDKIEEVKAHEN